MTYLRLLDAEATARIGRKLQRSSCISTLYREHDRARRAWESHLARARWMTEKGYRHLLRGGAPTEFRAGSATHTATSVRFGALPSVHSLAHGPWTAANGRGDGYPWLAPIGDRRARMRTCGRSMRLPSPMNFYCGTRLSERPRAPGASSRKRTLDPVEAEVFARRWGVRFRAET